MKNYSLRAEWPWLAQILKRAFLFIGLVPVYYLFHLLILKLDPVAGYVDPSIWLLILISLICFKAVLFLSFWILKAAWSSLGLPALSNMVLHFKRLTLCQQFGFYYASFALLLLAGVGCLIAIC